MGSLGWALPTQDPFSVPSPRLSRKAVTSLWELEGRRAAWGNRVVGCPLALREDRPGHGAGWAPRLSRPCPACISYTHGHHTRALTLTHTPTMPLPPNAAQAPHSGVHGAGSCLPRG